MVNQLQPLIYLGRYRKAYALADQARRIYEKHGDKLRLARLDTNVGNVLYVRTGFSEAIELYRRSYEYFVNWGSGGHRHRPAQHSGVLHQPELL